MPSSPRAVPSPAASLSWASGTGTSLNAATACELLSKPPLLDPVSVAVSCSPSGLVADREVDLDRLFVQHSVGLQNQCDRCGSVLSLGRCEEKGVFAISNSCDGIFGCSLDAEQHIAVTGAPESFLNDAFDASLLTSVDCQLLCQLRILIGLPAGTDFQTVFAGLADHDGLTLGKPIGGANHHLQILIAIDCVRFGTVQIVRYILRFVDQTETQGNYINLNGRFVRLANTRPIWITEIFR